MFLWHISGIHEVEFQTKGNIPAGGSPNVDGHSLQENERFMSNYMMGGHADKGQKEHASKSNSLTRKPNSQVLSTGDSNTTNPCQRLCTSEQSSPMVERRVEELKSFSSSSIAAKHSKDIISPCHQNVKDQKENCENSEGNFQHHNEMADKKAVSDNSTISEFAQVSEDMNDLVYHLNSIQNDISELAGKPISICDNT